MVPVMNGHREKGPLFFRHALCHLMIRHCLASVNVTLHVPLERIVVDSAGLFANESWLVNYIT